MTLICNDCKVVCQIDGESFCRSCAHADLKCCDDERHLAQAFRRALGLPEGCVSEPYKIDEEFASFGSDDYHVVVDLADMSDYPISIDEESYMSLADAKILHRCLSDAIAWIEKRLGLPEGQRG